MSTAIEIWHFSESELQAESGRRYVLGGPDGPVGFGDALTSLREDRSARNCLLETLAEAPMDAFFFETPPLSTETAGWPFEFVLTPAPPLVGLSADPSAFAEHFEDSGPVAVFENLSGDALLIAPAPKTGRVAYAHLAAFVRGAPDAQQHELLRAAATAALSRVGERPIWLSTSGLGVPWLHLRIDSQPKYYVHSAYKSVNRTR